jgi:hypothetical protein
MCGRGPTPGVFMSGHFRFCFVAFFLAGLSASPASSSPFDVLFNSAPADATAPAPAPAAASAPAEDECLPRPGKSTADGQHWVYRYDGHRKCWFQASEGAANVKKPVHHAARHRVTAPSENESALHNRKAVLDAREELLSSAAKAAPQPPTPPAPEIKIADAVPVTGGAAPVPPAPVIADPAPDQLATDHPTPRVVDVKVVPAAAPTASDTVAASEPRAASVAIPSAEAGDAGGRWTATWLGVLLMALGLVFVLGASRILRGGRAGPAISPSEDRVARHRARPAPEPSFAFGPNTFSNTFNRPAPAQGLFRPQNARPAI